jgi:NADH dehydrogenase (ubiquinone) 1 beta subcomplex subunit 9
MTLVRPQPLNDIFLAAANQTRQKARSLTHNQKVAHLYRHSLRVLLSWAVDRDIFNEAATELRARFDAQRGVSASAASRLLKEGDDELFSFTHPDPYKCVYMPGGSKFMRNPPLPMEVCFPDGNLPADAPRYTVNPDMSLCTPETGRNAVGTVLVDFYKKNME